MEIIHSKNYSYRKKIIQKIFIQKTWQLFIQRDYSFVWKISYCPGLPSSYLYKTKYISRMIRLLLDIPDIIYVQSTNHRWQLHILNIRNYCN